MRLKSPSDETLCVSLTNGTGIRIGPEARDVPAEFLKASFAAGAIPEGVDAKDFDDSPDGPDEETKPALLIAGVKKMLVENQDDFTGAGLPNRNVLSRIVGWNVSVQELSVAWEKIQAESKDPE
jgi:hypothetical protein